MNRLQRRVGVVLFAGIALLGRGTAAVAVPVYSAEFGAWYEILPVLSWTEAEALAVSRGGHLASIGSAEENAFLVSLVDAIPGADRAWIGLNDFEEEGEFVWSDGAPLAFVNWAEGEPNSAGDEDGVELYGSRFHVETRRGDWNDQLAGHLRPAIAEYPSPATQPVPEPASAGLLAAGLALLAWARRRRPRSRVSLVA